MALKTANKIRPKIKISILRTKRVLVIAEFDQIAEVYDETRRPLDEETVLGMKEMLTKYGCHSILEIGVGTGRVTVPLVKSGFEITGVDISVKMMERANAKGIKNLVLATGNQMPFRNETFNATIMAHVFHLLEDPMSVLRESSRVSGTGVFALVRKGGFGGRWWGFFGRGPGSAEGSFGNNEPIDESTRKYIEERRARFRAIAKKYGWSPDREQRRARNWQREQEILESHPPDDLKIVSDVVVNDSPEERIARFEKGAFSSMLGMPEGMRMEIVKEMRASAERFPARASQPRHEVYQLAMWKPESLLN
jgi:SAM-dependent methyltransferase